MIFLIRRVSDQFSGFFRVCGLFVLHLHLCQLELLISIETG